MLKLCALATVIAVCASHKGARGAEPEAAMPVRKGAAAPGKRKADAPTTSAAAAGKKSVFSQLLPSRGKGDVFNTDYRTRKSDAPVPVAISGSGLGGRDIPVGAEDAYRATLPADFCPTDLVRVHPDLAYSSGQPIFLRREAAQSFERMCRDASSDGVRLKVVSGYRDYGHQTRLYAEAIKKRGKNQKTVARPGRSEHFLGTTADVTNGNPKHLLSRSFGDSPEGQWLSRNAARYGWKMTVMSGPGKRSHNDEPWHIRYLGGGTGPQPEPRPSLMRRIGKIFGLGK